MHQLSIYIVVLFFSNVYFIWASDSADSKTQTPLWTWECKSEKCVPIKVLQSQELMQSLETCNMLCSGPQLWPMPTGSVNVGTTAVPVRLDFFQIEVEQAPNDAIQQHLRDAFLLFKQNLENIEGKFRFGDSHSIVIRVSVNDSDDPKLRLNTDESYQITVEPVSSITLLVQIAAPSFCGARHAFETLSQLIWLDPYMNTLLMIQDATITDKPRFGYRGLMIDTARNHIPFSDLLRAVDAMASTKLNTLHWHASDSQAFSIQFDSVPELARYGANSPLEFYSSDQVKALVWRARLRGIRVIIEIDSPAHVSHALNCGPEDRGEVVQCIDVEPSAGTKYCEEPPCGQINPLNPFSLELLQIIFSDIIQLTGVDDIFHLGGDDISVDCWTHNFNNSNPFIFWQEYTRSLIQRIEYVNGKLPNLTIFWPSRTTGRLRTEMKDLNYFMGLQVRATTWTEKHIAGIRKIISHEDAWDLNTGFGTWHGTTAKTPYNSWQRFYEHRPWIKSGKRNNIIGGEATLWSWTMGEGIEARIWPRALALAERLWSDLPEGITPKVYARLDIHRSRLAERNIIVSPLWSQWCTQNPYTCS